MQMTNKKTKIMVIFMAIMTVFIMLNTSMKVARATNYYDTSYCFSYVNGGDDRTQGREKQDTSGVYLYCYSSSNSDECFYADVYGASNSVDNGTYCGNDRNYSVYEGDTYYMYNWVNETYASAGQAAYAYILGKSSGNYVEDFSILWSPDNYQGYAGE